MSEPEKSVPVVDAEHPWLGLLSFTEKTRKFFFGRDAEIAEIIDRIQENTLTVLFGQSGLGKTSLLGAGVLPRLQEMDYAPVLVRLDHNPDGPTLLEQTRRALLGAMPGIVAPADSAEITLWEMFHRKPVLLSEENPVPVVLFDQFEEIFTLGDEAQAEAWIEQVSDLLQNRPPQSLEARFEENRRLARDYDFLRSPVRFVFSLREDYLHHLERWKTRLPLLVQNRMSLQLLNGPRALDAVIGPASLRPEPLVSAEVAATIVRTVADVPPDTPLQQIRAVPPLLSLLCEQLNLARIAAGAPVIDGDMVSGQSHDILRRFYEESFSVFPEAHRESIRRIVEDPPMVTEGGHRNSMVREDAETILSSAGVPEPRKVFDTLIHRRLLTAEEHGGLQRLEITHDVLVPLVVRSRKERRDRQIEREKLAAEELARIEAAKRTRLRALLAGSLVLLALSIIAGFYAFAQKSLAERSAVEADLASGKATAALEDSRRSEQMAKDALARQKEEEEKQLALFRQASMSDQQAGVRAADTGKDTEALAHFERALRYWPGNSGVAERAFGELLAGRGGVGRHRMTSTFQAGVIKTIFSRDGSKVAACDASGLLRVIDASTWETLWEASINAYPRTLVFSPDGTKLSYGGHDQVLHLFDTATGKQITSFPFGNYVLSSDFSPDGKLIAGGSGDLTARVFNLSDFKLVWSREAPEPVLHTCFSPDGTKLALGTVKGGFHMMNTASGDREWNAETEGDINGIEFQPDGKRVAFISTGKSISIHDADGANPWKRELGEQPGHFAYSPDGNHLAIGTDDSSLFVLNLKDSTEWRYRCDNPVWNVAFSPEGDRLLVASSDSTLRVMRPDRAVVLWQAKFPHFVQCCAFSPDGDHIAAGSGDKTLRIFRDSGNPPLFLQRCESTVWSALPHPDGTKISLVSGDYLVRTIDSATGTEIWRNRIEGQVTKLAVSPNGGRVFAAAENKEIRAYDAKDGTILWKRTFPELIHCLSASTDNVSVIAGFADRKIERIDTDGSTRWTTDTKGIPKLLVHEKTTGRIIAGTTFGNVTAFSPDGKEAWNAVIEGEVLGLALSPDGTRIAACGKGNRFTVYKTGDGDEVWRKPAPGQVFATAWSPDDSVIAIGGSDNILRLVRAADGSEVWSTTLPRSSNLLAFSPDGKRLAAGSYDFSIRLFDVTNGSERWASRLGDTLLAAFFTPDGKRLVAGGYDGTLRGFDLAPLPSGKDEAELLRSLLVVRGNSVFDEIGRLQPPQPADLEIHLARLRDLGSKPDPTPFEQAVLWETSKAPGRNLSPSSEIPSHRVATDRYKEATTAKTTESANSLAPWHPLAAASIARYVVDDADVPDRAAFLCRLAASRLKTAGTGPWPKSELALWHGIASGWMRDKRQNAIALETAKAGLVHDPGQLECLRVIVNIGTPDETLTYGEKILTLPSATSFDWGTAAYNFSKKQPPDETHIQRSRELLRIMRGRFPENDRTVSFYSGWALLNLGESEPALAQFLKTLRILAEEGVAPVRDQLTGVIITGWNLGKPDLVLEYARKLAAIEPAYFKPGGLDNINWPDKEITPFRAAIEDALKRDPQLAGPSS